MREHPNAAIVRRAYEALACGDAEVLGEVVVPEAMGSLRAALEEDVGCAPSQSRRIVPLALAAAGHLVVAIDHVCARRGGRPVDVEGVVVFTLVDLRIVMVTRLQLAA